MSDEDFTEELYEEKSGKVTYSRSSLNRQGSQIEDEQTLNERDTSDRQDYEDEPSSIAGRTASTDEFESRDQDWNTGSTELVKEESQDWSENSREDKKNREKHGKTWSIRPEDSDHPFRAEKPDKKTTYYKVTKWEIQYDNKNHVRSMVNAPKGLHRRKADVKRKRVPDVDVLADSTGWEFEYGPEFHQQEGDVPYMPQERTVSRGAYRYYGVRRNNSDTDRNIHEDESEIRGLDNGELKYGPEFLQDDIPHLLEQKDRRVGRGAYRFYDVLRNENDEYPVDPPGVDYRTSRATVDELPKDSEADKDVPKGKPFKRTILKKAFYQFEKPISEEEVRPTTRIEFIPGEGSETTHEGKSTRLPGLQVKKHPSIRSIFKSKKETKGSVRRDLSRTEREFNSRDAWNKAKVPNSYTNYSVSSISNSKDRETKDRWNKIKKTGSNEYVTSNVSTRKEKESRPKDYWNKFRGRNFEESQTSRATSRKGKEKSSHPWDKWEKTKKRGDYEEQRPSRTGAKDVDRDYKHAKIARGKVSFDGTRTSKRRQRKDEDRDREYSNKELFRRAREDFGRDTMDEDEVLKKFPPYVESRIHIIRKKMSSPSILFGKLKMTGVREREVEEHRKKRDRTGFKQHRRHPPEHDKSSKKGYDKSKRIHGRDVTDYSGSDDEIRMRIHGRDVTDYSESDDEIDLRNHMNNPHAHGKSIKEGYEKYVNENGSEIWIKSEEKYSELRQRS